MRLALWLLGLFAVAAATAQFAGSNPGTVTLYWAPHRVDLSLNLVLLVLLACFVAGHLFLRGVAAMFGIPRQARRWRLQQKERAIAGALLESLSHLAGGRFIRARKAAELVVTLEGSMARSGEALAHADALHVMAHLLAAEAAHALQDRAVRDGHLQQALDRATSRDAVELCDGVYLRAARWAFDDRDPGKSLEWLERLSQGASRRTVALRLRFKAARLSRQPVLALEYARVLTKHRAFSEMAGKSIARGLALEHVMAAHDPTQLERAWQQLDLSERLLPDVAMQAAERLLELGGSADLSRQWVAPVWEQWVQRAAQQTSEPTATQWVRMVRILERGFGEHGDPPDAHWLGRIEAAQMARPRDPVLQYLAGMACMRLSLWGKAQQLLKQSLSLLQDQRLKRDAWHALARMAEQRNEPDVATHAYQQALKESAKT
jgi:HemY protein